MSPLSPLTFWGGDGDDDDGDGDDDDGDVDDDNDVMMTVSSSSSDTFLWARAPGAACSSSGASGNVF